MMIWCRQIERFDIYLLSSDYRLAHFKLSFNASYKVDMCFVCWPERDLSDCYWWKEYKCGNQTWGNKIIPLFLVVLVAVVILVIRNMHLNI